MKRARRRSAGQQSDDASYSDGEDYQQRGGPAGSASLDLQKVELRRLKNREAARRVRERKSNQLNQYKSQVDELKRENQKLLQIIAQLQTASIGCVSAGPLAPATTTSTLGPDAEADGPAGTASCVSAGLAPDSIDSAGPSVVRSAEALLQLSPLQRPLPPLPPPPAAAPAGGTAQHRVLASTTSCPPGGPGGGAAAGQDGNASGSCVLSQPGNVSVCGVVSSSTQQLLSGCHSAPQAFLQPTSSMQQVLHSQVLLQRTCGCVGDEECEECEGVRVTLSSASNLPLVTTPGPRPKLLTLEDLNLAGLSRAASLHTGSLMSAPLLATTRVSGSSLSRDDPAAAAAGHSVDGGAVVRPHHHLHQHHHQQHLGQITEQQQPPQQQGAGNADAAVGMVVDYVGTLEPSSRGAVGHGTRLDSHSSSGHAVFGPGAEAHAHVGVGGGGGTFSESCYVRKSSSNRSTRQRADPAAAGSQQQPVGAAQGGSGAAAAAAAGASGSGLAVGGSYQHEQLQQQQQEKGMGAAVAAGFGAAAPTPAVRPSDDAAAAADVVMGDPSGGALAALGCGPAAAASNGFPPGVSVVGSNSSMARPGSYAAADPDPPLGAPGSGSILVPLAAMQPPPAAAAAVAAAAAPPPPQPEAAAAGDRGYHGHKSSSSSSKKPAQKLMRSIAAAVNGFVRPSSRRGSGPNTPRGGGPADAALLRQQQQQQQQEQDARRQQQDLASRSLPVSMLRHCGGTALQQQFGAVGGVGSGSFTAGAAAAAQQQQQALLLSSGSGMFASGYSSAGLLSAQQQLLLMGQMTQGFSSGEFSGSVSLQQQQSQQQQQQQQTLEEEEEDAIILEAQLLLQQQHQQRLGAGSSRQAQQQQVVAAGAAAPGGSSSSRRPSGVMAMDTTPIWPPGQDSSPRLPPAPQQQQQQQQASFRLKAAGPSGAASLSQPLPAAAVLPLNFQATYTDALAASTDAAAAAAMMAGANSDGCLNDDAVMQLARQEGVYIDDPEGEAFF